MNSAIPGDPLANHPRLVNKNPLVDELAKGADPKTVIPDDTVIVRGGRNYQPQPGEKISAQMGSSVGEAASGLPHGTVRVATAGAIRAAGGTVELIPEDAWKGGPPNTWHVNVTEGPNLLFRDKTSPTQLARRVGSTRHDRTMYLRRTKETLRWPIRYHLLTESSTTCQG